AGSAMVRALRERKESDKRKPKMLRRICFKGVGENYRSTIGKSVSTFTICTSTFQTPQCSILIPKRHMFLSVPSCVMQAQTTLIVVSNCVRKMMQQVVSECKSQHSRATGRQSISEAGTAVTRQLSAPTPSWTGWKKFL